MKKAKRRVPAKPRVVAQFMLGKKVIHQIVRDKSSESGYAVEIGPGHCMAIAQRTIEEIVAYGTRQGFTVCTEVA